jgi:hypothetical protein
MVLPLSAEAISDADRAYLVAHLEMTQEFVRDATRDLSKEQWLFKPEPLRWSIAQCIDHIARSEEYVLKLVREKVLTSNEPLAGAFPSTAKGRLGAREKPRRMTPVEDAVILRWMTDRTSAVATPVEKRPPIEEVAPRSSFDDPLSALQHFLKVRAATIAYVKTTQDDLRGHFTEVVLPGFPDLKFHDAYQWLLRMSAHTERHLMQVHQVKRAADYPPRTR